MATAMAPARNGSGLLKKAVNEQGAAKIGLFGEAGSGKTVTGALLALSLSKQFHGGAPVAMYDTERGSDFLIQIFEAEGVELLVNKDRSFIGMLKTLKEAEQVGCCAFVADSVTHAWVDIVDSYCAKRKISRPEFQHWRDIKKQWQEWPDAYLNSALHCIVNGRSGFEYEYQKDDATGKKELIKGDTKMRVEGQFGYEPHLLIEMERIRETGGEHVGGRFIHRAHILKDRAYTLNGKHFDFADRDRYTAGDYMRVYETFKSHFDALKMGHHRAVTTSNSESLFPNGQSEYYQREQEKKIALEEIIATLQLLWPGQDAKSKSLRISIMETLWDTRSWSAVEALPLDKIQFGLRVLREYEAISNNPNHTEQENIAEQIALLRESASNQAPKDQDPLEGYRGKNEVVEFLRDPKVNLPPAPKHAKREPGEDPIQLEATTFEGQIILTGQGTFRVKDDLKKINGWRFDKPTKSWSVPVNSRDALRKVCEEHDVELVEM